MPVAVVKQVWGEELIFAKTKKILQRVILSRSHKLIAEIE